MNSGRRGDPVRADAMARPPNEFGAKGRSAAKSPYGDPMRADAMADAMARPANEFGAKRRPGVRGCDGPATE